MRGRGHAGQRARGWTRRGERTAKACACGANGTSRWLLCAVVWEIHSAGPTRARRWPSFFLTSSTFTCWPGRIVPTAGALVLASDRTVALRTTVCVGVCMRQAESALGPCAVRRVRCGGEPLAHSRLGFFRI